MGGYQPIRIDWERGILPRGADPENNGTLVPW